MNRKQRMMARKNPTVANLNEAANKLERVISNAGIPPSDRESFLNWAVGSLWNSFKDERMNQRILIENQVRQLGLRFPNGTVKKEYSVSFDLPTDKIYDIKLEGTEELGLAFTVGEDGKCSLSGKPTVSGDFTLRLLYKTVQGEPESELLIPLAFNPNPRDLWRNIPTDKDIQYYKEDSDTAYLKVEAEADGTPRKDIVAASQRGRSHAQEGKARDDHFSLFHCEESDWYIIAVADG
ncbi:MAG: protein phosphatase 2C domain-containing protein, partial [Bacteroides sp.]|nr:protein phosphatase 2C domain-containing protein [Bacteroides sp.]